MKDEVRAFEGLRSKVKGRSPGCAGTEAETGPGLFLLGCHEARKLHPCQTAPWLFPPLNPERCTDILKATSAQIYTANQP